MDRKISGCFLGNRIPSKYAASGSYATQSTKYSVLSKIVPMMNLHIDDVVVDVGCGKGRLICYLLYKGVKAKIIGVEIDERVACFCKKHLPRNNNVEIIVGNILDISLPEATVYYLFNPFNESVLKQLLQRIEDTSTNGVTLVYANPQHNEVLINNKMWNLEKSVIVKTLCDIYNPFCIEFWRLTPQLSSEI